MADMLLLIAVSSIMQQERGTNGFMVQWALGSSPQLE
jgi:hypothetical protein